MKTTAIIVTYSNRYNYVKEVTDSLQNLNLQKILVVNNDSSLKNYESLRSVLHGIDNVEIINLNQNTGSAYAYKTGIEQVLNGKESDFIWLLDDDNLPEPEAFNILRNKWSELSYGIEPAKLMLASLRSDKQKYIDAVKCNNPQSIIGEVNIFRSFHIKQFNLFRKKRMYNNDISFGKVTAVPYGGMFFHKDLIKEIGFPDSSYFVYCDDFDFCCRHINNGGSIFLILESRINDIEKSWNVSGKAIKYIAYGDNKNKIYYSIRNRIFLEKQYLIKSWSVYLINMLIYSVAVTILALLKFKFNNIFIYYIAVYHGLAGKMGYNKNYNPGNTLIIKR